MKTTTAPRALSSTCEAEVGPAGEFMICGAPATATVRAAGYDGRVETVRLCGDCLPQALADDAEPADDATREALAEAGCIR